VPKPGILAGLFGRRPEQPQVYATPEIDAVLKGCSQRLTFSWGSGDLCEMRLATDFSAVLAELTGGLSYYPEDGRWYSREGAAMGMLTEAREYEHSVPDDELVTHLFEGWL
jgi:hypothetical protein